jgi:hypothetical protein
MSPSKNKNYAASVRQRLLNYARSSGQDFIFVLRTFAMERLLYRLSRSPYADSFVLKGAMLFKLWTGDFYRPTRDIDVLAFKSVTIDFMRSFLLPPIDSILKTKSFEMTWSAGGPWLAFS